MPWKTGATVAEARTKVSAFLQDSGCYDICAECPLYPGGEGCCDGCAHLLKDGNGEVLGCGNSNLSCLSFTCGALNFHLLSQGRLEEFVLMTHDLPREGRRGCQKRGDRELLQIQETEPAETVAHVRIPSDLRKEDQKHG